MTGQARRSDIIVFGENGARREKGGIGTQVRPSVRGGGEDRYEVFDLGSGLTVRTANFGDFTETSVISDPRPTVCIEVMLEGGADATVGDVVIPMPERLENGAGWRPVASIFAQCRSELFVRRPWPGNRFRRVVVSMTPEWLDRFPPSGDLAAVRAFAQCHLAHRIWRPSAAEIGLAEQIVAPPEMPAFLRRLHVESRTMGLIEAAFRRLCGDPAPERPECLTPRDRRRLARIDAFIDECAGEPLTAAKLARETGLSVTSLQRLIREAHGTSISKYLRLRRLSRARRALEAGEANIATAAHLAGYGSPANFSTAFKKEFGFSPGAVRRGML